MTRNVPKSAVILAAGLGARLRPLTDLCPKPLVEVNGTPILHNALRNLEAVGVEEVTIVVGYRKDAIQYACGRRFGELKINYLETSVFDCTGSAFSLWLARDVLLAGDCLVLEGDVFFEQDALRYLMASEVPDVAAVAPLGELTQGAAVLLSDSGFISGFCMSKAAAGFVAEGPRLFKTMNLLRFSAPTLKTTIVPALDDIVTSGAIRAYADELVAYLIEKRGLQLGAARCKDLRWCGIDSVEDLRIAELIFQRRSPPLTSRQDDK
ncbi:phosphocholine cytidylyltransferase family protein [Bradyrhizobium arachidis]|uniref:phosphocholine cytidylyltransferase family protein n=1 Tax=Bradyrhizobium arachidis TaxID=858423 RepID=UPI0021627445|nr:phosphocholine cytidylyltransferase family protein [Bradyrhizobium arachidis]UVO30487.1 phosphocholine cytidylyltransferase family protein [Bradyrhizobium arachidis]